MSLHIKLDIHLIYINYLRHVESLLYSYNYLQIFIIISYMIIYIYVCIHRQNALVCLPFEKYQCTYYFYRDTVLHSHKILAFGFYYKKLL